MASVGVAYSGFERWTLAADYHYIDYRNTTGFENSGFDPQTGAVRGLGWDSVSALAFGAQYELTPCTALRMGYTWNTNPIQSDRTIFNISSPVILQNTIYFGASCRLTERFILTAAYAHAFENSIEGIIQTRFGPIPGSTVESNVSADTIMIGATVKF
jgi:long-chain fatty acid transport protein